MVDKPISDSEYIATLETNNGLLRQLLEQTEIIKENYKDLFMKEAATLAKLRSALELRDDLKNKIGCFVPKDAPPEYTEQELIRMYNIA